MCVVRELTCHTGSGTLVEFVLGEPVDTGALDDNLDLD
jgi:hypothetical protein